MNQIINELFKKDKLLKNDMRVKKTGDIERSVGYLMGRASRRQHTTLVRALGQAIETQEQII